MMREKMLLVLLALLLLCSGCAGAENTYRVETVVWIPVNPTEAPATESETLPEETETPTEAAKESERTGRPASTTGSFSGGTISTGRDNSSGRNNSSDTNHSDGKSTQPQQTKPAATTPAENDPPETEPPATEPERSVYDISGYVVGSLEYAILDQINAARGEEGLPALNLDGRLSAIASFRAYELSRLWSHTRPDGRSYETVLGDYGYSASAVTELLVYASGSGDGAQMAQQWLASDSHRASLLSTSFSTAGIGIYRANGYTYVCCLLVE